MTTSMPYRCARPLALSLVTALVPLSVVTASGPAVAGGCSRTPAHTIKVASRASYYQQHTKRTYGGEVVTTRDYFRKNVNTGTARVRFRMCKDLDTGHWRVLDAMPYTPHLDLTSTTTGRRTSVKPADDRARGYGIFFRRLRDRSLQLDAVRCTKQPQKLGSIALQTVKGLLQLPWRYSRHPYAVGAWAAGQTLPDAPEDKYWCGRVGTTAALALRFRKRDGKPFVKWRKYNGGVLRWAKTPEDQWACGGDVYQYCATSTWETIRLAKP